MYIGAVARHTEIHMEADDRDWLALVEAVLSDHRPHLRNLLRNFLHYRGIPFGRAVFQSVILSVQCVLKSDFCRF